MVYELVDSMVDYLSCSGAGYAVNKDRIFFPVFYGQK